jgi:hypothetical protein
MNNRELVAVFHLGELKEGEQWEHESINYDENWNHFMLAVEKVNHLLDTDELKGFDFDIYRSMQDWILSAKLENAFDDLVTIIKGYNEFKKSEPLIGSEGLTDPPFKTEEV